MKTPEVLPPGVMYRVSFGVRNESVGSFLAELSPITRHVSPGDFTVHSLRSYLHVVDDEVDGVSEKQIKLDSYEYRLGNHDRAMYNAAQLFEVQGRTVLLGVKLGHQAAHDIVSSPLFETGSRVDTYLPVFYKVPGKEPLNIAALSKLRTLLQSEPPGAYMRPRLVSSEMANKAFFALLKGQKA